MDPILGGSERNRAVFRNNIGPLAIVAGGENATQRASQYELYRCKKSPAV